MKYLCLGFLDKQKMDQRSRAEIDQLMKDCQPPLQALYETGRVVVDVGLDGHPVSLRRQAGQVVTMDGPFAETKEALGGAFILDAADQEEALRLARMHPTTQMAEGEGLGWRLEIHPAPYFKSFETPRD